MPATVAVRASPPGGNSALCRYITRPAIANDRLKRNRKGHVVLRLHLIRFHRVLAPNAKLRVEIIPSAPANTNASLADHGDASHPSAPARIILAHLGLPAQGPPRSPARAFDRFQLA